MLDQYKKVKRQTDFNIHLLLVSNHNFTLHRTAFHYSLHVLKSRSFEDYLIIGFCKEQFSPQKDHSQNIHNAVESNSVSSDQLRKQGLACLTIVQHQIISLLYRKQALIML